MKPLAMAVGGVGFWIAAASAADFGAPSYPPPGKSEAEYYNWTGLYTGAFVGEAHSIWTIDFFRNDNHGHAEVASDGIAGGALIGYNWQMNRHFVFGVEADLGWANASQNNRVFDNDHTDSSIGMFGSVRGRAGYAIDRLMLFATAGVALADVSQNIQKGRNAGEQVVSENQTPVGYVVGGGAEYAFNNRWVGRIEYLYSNYGSTTLTNADGNTAIFNNDLSLFRVGLSYRF